jgi:hypothetical protein
MARLLLYLSICGVLQRVINLEVGQDQTHLEPRPTVRRSRKVLRPIVQRRSYCVYCNESVLC